MPDFSPSTELSADAPLPSRAWRRWSADWVELLGSMRFAIALLCLISLASVIGTVVKQNEPYNNYVNQFGPFWARYFDHLGLYNLYSAPWFLTILAFLVISTSLCVARNTPKILADLRSFKEHVREQSLRAFHHKAEGQLAMSREAALERVSQVLSGQGWQAKAQVRDDGIMVAARAGRANKLGYVAAHSAIVLICIGGLLDGDLIVRAQMLLGGKSSFSGGGLIRDVALEHRLSPVNPTFRANLFVPEGQRAGTAVLTMPDGVVLQDLPFDVELKKFTVDFYSNGMPKLFASDIVLHDRDTGATTQATVKVNEPVVHRGITIYQSSFDDGGSRLKLKAWPLRTGGKAFPIEIAVGENTSLSNGDERLTLEMASLKVINVENTGAGAAAALDAGATLNKHLGTAVSADRAKTMRNVGPAITYRLRDSAGQAVEFHNYMLPLEIDGQRLFALGVRESAQDNFRYLRIPVDEKGELTGWLRLRQALQDPALREKAARRYATQVTPADKPMMVEQLRTSSQRALSLFAGEQSPTAGNDAASPQAKSGGLAAVSAFIEANVPEAERERVSEVLLRIVSGALFELNQLARERDGLKPLEQGDATSAFMTQSVLSLTDSFFYPAPLLLQLEDFQQVQASVFQVTRAPGKTLVYLGAVALILGVCAMLYIRERRLWVWLADANPGSAAESGQESGATQGTHVRMALSTPRRTLDIDREFQRLRDALLGSSAPPAEKT